MLHAEVLVKQAQKSPFSKQFALLNQFFEIIGQIMDRLPEFSYFIKLSADALLLSSRYHADTFRFFKFPKKWEIATPLSAVDFAIRFCCSLVKGQPGWSGAWNDLGVALLRKCQLTKKNSPGCMK
ncbi:unnamed protein product [Gongylonema pulchrum]|uniref:Uncharacterized protein n=1 Tax=Gongylonema pulchrum TaxID=637853 RepID=A0A183DLH7_9BILA|nr:unnamed protein product [Gongylonema pulchrum]